jgi:hypothetical protein
VLPVGRVCLATGDASVVRHRAGRLEALLLGRVMRGEPFSALLEDHRRTLGSSLSAAQLRLEELRLLQDAHSVRAA